MKITQAEIILYVSNQEKSKTFYQTLLDKTPSLDVPGMTEFTVNNFLKIGLMPNSGIAKIITPTMPHPNLGNGIPRCELYFLTDDLENHFTKMLNFGAKLISPISKRDWGDQVGYIADYDGHIIALAKKIQP